MRIELIECVDENEAIDCVNFHRGLIDWVRSVERINGSLIVKVTWK